MSYIENLLQGAEIEWKPLGDVAELKRGTSITKKTSTEGKYPVISGGQQPAYYIDTFNRDGETITVAGSGAYAGFVMFWNEPIFVSDAFSIKADEKQILSRYIYHFLLNIQEKIHDLKAGGGVPHVYAKDVARFLVPIPCPDNPTKSLEIQRKIVEILDKFTTLEAELEAELDCRKRQYEYYRNQLLSFDMLNRGGQKLNNVIWLKMGDIAEIYGGLTGKSKVDFGIGDAYFIPYKNIFDHSAVKLDKLEKVRVDVGERQHNVKYGDVLFTGSSETPEEVGMSSSVTTEPQSNVYLNSFCFGVRFNEGIELMPEFSKFLFRSPIMRRQIYKTASGVTRFNVSKERFKKILIPIPPLSEQQRIVSILDKFDTLTTSISEGLPKEIELRRKQYEYYRNELLSFSKPKVIS